MHREKLSHKEAARLYYYYTKKQKEPDKHAELKEEICAIVAENKGRYGYRRVTQELRNRGLHHNHTHPLWIYFTLSYWILQFRRNTGPEKRSWPPLDKAAVL